MNIDLLQQYWPISLAGIFAAYLAVVNRESIFSASAKWFGGKAKPKSMGWQGRCEHLKAVADSLRASGETELAAKVEALLPEVIAAKEVT